MEYEYAIYERSNFKTWHKSCGWYNTLDHAELKYKQRVAGRKMSKRCVTGVRLVKRPRNPETETLREEVFND